MVSENHCCWLSVARAFACGEPLESEPGNPYLTCVNEHYWTREQLAERRRQGDT
jgi:hypothetical protein